jgi:hypothetical protein
MDVTRTVACWNFEYLGVVDLPELHELPRQAPASGTPTRRSRGGPDDEATQHQPMTMTSSRWPSVARISGGGPNWPPNWAGYPADLGDESIARNRADAAARKQTDRDPAKKWAHLTELLRQRDVAAAGRAAVADLDE